MNRKTTRKANGNVFKTIIRTVLHEELEVVEKRLREELEVVEKRLKRDLVETFAEKVDAIFRKYRDDTLTKLDTAIGKLQTANDQQNIHQGQHDDLTDIPERLEKLEDIHPGGQHPR